MRAGGEIELVDRGAAFLDLHAHLGDVAERADAGIELLAVGACEQAARPVAARLEGGEPLARRGDAVGIGDIGKGHHAVGVADIEGVADQRHAERLAEVLHEGAAHFGDAVAVLVAQQRDAVGADAERRGAPHRRLHRVVKHRPRGARDLRRFRDQHVAIGQHLDPARMVEAGRERIDLEPGRDRRLLALAPAPGGRHLQRRQRALRLRFGNGRRLAPGRRGRGARQLSPLQRDAADERDELREDAGKCHENPLSNPAALSNDGSSKAPRGLRPGSSTSPDRRWNVVVPFCARIQLGGGKKVNLCRLGSGRSACAQMAARRICMARMRARCNSQCRPEVRSHGAHTARSIGCSLGRMDRLDCVSAEHSFGLSVASRSHRQTSTPQGMAAG